MRMLPFVVIFGLSAGVVFFTICWWDPAFFEAMDPEGSPSGLSWRHTEKKSFLCTWLFTVPLIAYVLWQVLYFLIVDVLRRQRLLKDPEVMTSYRGLSKKAQKANNIWWRLSGYLGDNNRLLMYILLQAVFTVATMALTVPIFLSYELHLFFQILKVSAAVWNGGQFLVEVMPRQVVLKEKRKLEVAQPQQNQHQD
ncbi:glycerophosphocholine acyltransferase 1-like [Bidens hawaiensis]|uniref:glycerophosphocholine acyltransferase 1-like n=1 Tax=Bidens hawaiensis TaxID=980011 RepID=UPI00404A284B